MNMYVHIHTGTRPPGLSTSTRFPAFPQVPCRRAHVVIRQDLQEGRCLICLTNACTCLRQTGQKLRPSHPSSSELPLSDNTTARVMPIQPNTAYTFRETRAVRTLCREFYR